MNKIGNKGPVGQFWEKYVLRALKGNFEELKVKIELKYLNGNYKFKNILFFIF